MRVEVSNSLCCGHGRCYSISPKVFSADDEGFPVQLGSVFGVPPGLEGDAEAGADACPEGAISILNDQTSS